MTRRSRATLSVLCVVLLADCDDDQLVAYSLEDHPGSMSAEFGDGLRWCRRCARASPATNQVSALLSKLQTSTLVGGTPTVAALDVTTMP